MNIFDINSIFFTVLGYPMSYLEFFGTVTGAVATWLSARAHIVSWPVGMVSVVLFVFLFYQIQLYPDMFLQVFFFVTNALGWWQWTHPKTGEEDRRNELKITPLSAQNFWLLMGVGAVATVLFGAIAQNLHEWFPVMFSLPSAYPYLDSFTSVMSIIATFLLIRKKLECWYVWLLVDLISTYMYFTKGVKVLGIEYGFYCLIAFVGAWHWTREYRSYTPTAA
ncbi:nicotinamide riboside transporter PnuC [Larkinella rosea]|uniref:Nicotinamide riboside transporter PnuC n=2 Tax=Larkinella rosea TaxID=2025312 RepID=A0A3P1C140_9BACT|nr:nicotinamide riboside transporter PnuC [Larkinella rosea]